jgi:hypothetical protein
MSHSEQNVNLKPPAVEDAPGSPMRPDGGPQLPDIHDLTPYRVIAQDGRPVDEGSPSSSGRRALPVRPEVRLNGHGPEGYGEELDPGTPR